MAVKAVLPSAMLTLFAFARLGEAQVQDPIYIDTYQAYEFGAGQVINFDAGTGQPAYMLDQGEVGSLETCQAICDDQLDCFGIWDFIEQNSYCYTLTATQPASGDVLSFTEFNAYDSEVLSWRYSNVCNPVLGDVLAENGACSCGSQRVQTSDRECAPLVTPSGAARLRSRAKRSFRQDIRAPW